MRADAILTADLHIRKDRPRARTDNYHTAMWAKWEQIVNLSKDNNGCPILVAGDLGHRAEWPDWLLREFIERSCGIWEDIYVVPGQHDLPNHKIDLLERSALGVLEAANIIKVLDNYKINTYIQNINNVANINISSFPWGFPIEKRIMPSRYNVAISHQLVMEGNRPDFKIDNFTSAKKLLKDFPEYDLILTGDNHKPFVVKHDGRLLVNPGSMMRTTAAQMDHRPRVYLWYAKENRVEPVYLNIEEDVLTRKHIDTDKEKKDRLKPLLDTIKDGQEMKLSYESNMEKHIAKNNFIKKVVNKIWECVK